MADEKFDQRVQGTLAALRSRTVVTAATIAAFTGTSKRQVYRDIDYLRELGYDIPAEAGYGHCFTTHINEMTFVTPFIFVQSRPCMKVVMALSKGWRWRGWRTGGDLSEELDVSPRNIRDAFDLARRRGFTIQSTKSDGYLFVSSANRSAA